VLAHAAYTFSTSHNKSMVDRATEDICHAILEDAGVDFVEHSAMAWLACTWITYSMSGSENAHVHKLERATRLLSIPADHAGSPHTHGEDGASTADADDLSHSARLWRCSIAESANAAVTVVAGHRSVYVSTGTGTSFLPRDDAATKRKRVTEEMIDDMNYLDEQRRQRVKQLVKYRKNI